MRRGPMPRCTLRQVTVVAGPALLAPRAEPEVVRPRAKRSCRTARRGLSDRPPPARSFPPALWKMDSSLLVLVIAFFRYLPYNTPFSGICQAWKRKLSHMRLCP